MLTSSLPGTSQERDGVSWLFWVPKEFGSSPPKYVHIIKLIEIVFNNPFHLLLNARFSPSQQSTWVRMVFVLLIWSTTMWDPWTPNSGLIAGGSVVTMVGLYPRDIAVQHWMLQPQLPAQNLAHCRLSVNTLQFINAWKSGSLLESSCAHTFTNMPLGVSFIVFCDLTTSSCFILTLYSPVVPKQTNLNQTSLTSLCLWPCHSLCMDCKTHLIKSPPKATSSPKLSLTLCCRPSLLPFALLQHLLCTRIQVCITLCWHQLLLCYFFNQAVSSWWIEGLHMFLTFASSCTY